ncbi:MAG TPA: nucleotidyltransferase family protein [Thermoplasmata archaeon]|nr:nucleotidyltransferase family protein [Thermoplasmata archaeon]
MEAASTSRDGPSARRATATVVLAAGASERFGGVPKATLPVAGVPAIARVVALAQASGTDPVVVVVGPHARETRGEVPDPHDVVWIENSAWADGRTGSIQAGLHAVPSDRSILLWPVDHPFVEAGSVQALLNASAHDRMAVWFIPTFEGHGGHPVLLDPVVVPKIEALPPGAPLRRLLPVFGPQVARVPVDDFGVTASVDTPEEYLSYSARALERVRERWTGG